jgi:serine/threonine protein kinase
MADSAPQSVAKTLRDGRYAVIRVLGEGAQAATFEAVDKKDGRLVALKRFRVRGAKSWKEVELAEREARVLASLSHPGLPRYIEHFEENGDLYLVTEKIEGESLLAIKKRGITWAERDAVLFLRGASTALDYLHNRPQPVIHRDIKPSNVLRRPDGSFVLIDFGSVRDRMKPEGGSTVVGTFGYMAPEQFQARAMPASDVYALGATALSMMTGSEPEDLPHKGLAIDVKAALGPRASPAMVEVLCAMLEPDPDKRASRIAPLLARFGSIGPEAGTPRKEQPPSRRGEPARSKEARVEYWGSKRERRHAEREARKERKEQKREQKRERKEREKREAFDTWRRLNQERWERRRPSIPPPVILLMVLGLSIGQIAVTLALRVFIPVLFALMSIVFGRGMRDAARKVSEAGRQAVGAMSQAKDFLRGKAPPSEAGAEGARVDDGAGPRVRVEQGGPFGASEGWRVEETDDRSAREAAEQEAQAEREAEQAARESQEKERRARGQR